MMSQGHILAGVFGIISTIGWAFQAFGGAFLYKRTWDFKNNHEGLDFQSVSWGWNATGEVGLTLSFGLILAGNGSI